MTFTLIAGKLPNEGESFGSVHSVNGKTGIVILNADDVGADTAGAAQTVLETLDNQKLDKIDYVQHFRGLFSSYAALTAALPTALDGDYAHIDSGSGFDRMVAIWDSDDSKWVVNAVNVGSNTDEVPEGSSNLYFTSERVRQTPLTGLNTNDDSPVTSSDTVEVAIGKLQAQNNYASEPEWVDVSTLSGFTKNQNVSTSGTFIEIAKIGGLVWIRGFITTTNSINANAELLGFTDANYLWDYVPRNASYSYDTVLNKTTIFELVDFSLRINQIYVGSGSHKMRLMTNQLFSAAIAKGVIPPTPIGKALN